MHRNINHICILTGLILLGFSSNCFAKDNNDWLSYVEQLGFWEKIAEIKAVSELPESKQKERIPALLILLKNKDQSIRIDAAAELAELHNIAPSAISHLIENFKYEHGEEGITYVEAVAAFGKSALPQLKKALESENWLIRTRACDTILEIDPKLYLDRSCKHEAP